MGLQKNGRITESEWQLMEIIWTEESVTQPQIMEQLEINWNKNTVHTFLKRLTEKGYLEVDKSETPFRYHALVRREECVREERDHFLERVYRGSISNMVTSFVTEGSLSKQETEELKKLLEKLGE